MALHLAVQLLENRRPPGVEIARVVSGAKTPTAEGIYEALWITVLITLSPTVAGVLLYLLGGAGLPRPDLIAWLEKNRPAIGSPALAATLRDAAE